jgi:hypothetical protein
MRRGYILPFSRFKSAGFLVSSRGSSLVEMALLLPVLLVISFASVTAGMVIDRHMSVTQFVRYAGGMSARGADFSQTGARNLLVSAGSELGMTATGGNARVYFSTVMKAAPGTVNAGQLVISERYVIGNAALGTSRIGSPSSSIWPNTALPLPNGQVADYENQPSARATLPASYSSLALNQRVHVIEVFHTPSDLNWTGFFSARVLYVRAFF